MNTLDMSAQIDKNIEEWRLKIRNIDVCRVVQTYTRARARWGIKPRNEIPDHLTGFLYPVLH
jgi:hypothetical protein